MGKVQKSSLARQMGSKSRNFRKAMGQEDGR